MCVRHPGNGRFGILLGKADIEKKLETGDDDETVDELTGMAVGKMEKGRGGGSLFRKKTGRRAGFCGN
ncbi:hypothetical protein CWI35_08330 [[Bacillus] caldolyticus]|uniref:Uncharacterized protein n=1 Tax=Bacillus caldolyticus TaxID=1394 RepID=A0ABM6QM33_BACCL|nr:hypothetical protein BGM21_01545 [Geobacillus thermoleovorans]AUI36531.1 hypothetical protein CWI35_08330 [[Bacillus] caldolyticus]